MPRLWYEVETQEEYNSRFTLNPYEEPRGRYRLARGANSLKEIAKNEAGKDCIITILKKDREYNSMRPIKEYRMQGDKLKFMGNLHTILKEVF